MDKSLLSPRLIEIFKLTAEVNDALNQDADISKMLDEICDRFVECVEARDELAIGATVEGLSFVWAAGGISYRLLHLPAFLNGLLSWFYSFDGSCVPSTLMAKIVYERPNFKMLFDFVRKRNNGSVLPFLEKLVSLDQNEPDVDMRQVLRCNAWSVLIDAFEFSEPEVPVFVQQQLLQRPAGLVFGIIERLIVGPSQETTFSLSRFGSMVCALLCNENENFDLGALVGSYSLLCQAFDKQRGHLWEAQLNPKAAAVKLLYALDMLLLRITMVDVAIDVVSVVSTELLPRREFVKRIVGGRPQFLPASWRVLVSPRKNTPGFWTSALVESSIFVNKLEKPGRGSNRKLQQEAEPDRVVCASCRKVASQMKMCAGCKAVHYCSVECQRNHWKSHKQSCNALL
eukprot:TRINITY_DN621_c1_g3_i2.p1 TRINITY_DN621_c1_g3~~TRINITY_DN621_c1_g3_i2.p1  ORF type:complete len:400 (-),score=40.36 TRINITY_DN621_c1_g3_i2:1323-2522(-)